MTTETQNQPETSETPKEEVPVLTQSPTEIAAREAGWVSKEEWVEQGKNPDEWRSAKEYQERGELFDEIHKLKEANKKQNAAFKALVDHHKKVRETAMQEALTKLRAEKKVALENHNIEEVFKIDEEIERVREQKASEPNLDVPEVDVGPTPYFKKWHRDNPWYDLRGESEASLFADAAGVKFKQKNPAATEQELLEHVESLVAKRFPEVFENPNKKKASEVNPRSTTNETRDTFKLNEEQERVCKMFVDQGIMTRKQYIDELRKLG